MQASAAPLSLSLAGFAGIGAAPSVRELISRAAEIGYRGVALDTSAPGVRPRDLSRGARRDLAAMLRRHELIFAGADLWIPPAHFADAANTDRAIAAVASSLGLAREIASLVPGSSATVSVSLPDEPAADVLQTLIAAARSLGARIADTRPGADANITTENADAIGVGVDPASLLLTGFDPAAETARLGPLVANTRLSDADHAGRAPLGAGRLDLHAYKIALTLADAAGPIIADMRGLPAPHAAARAALDRWNTTT